MVPSSLRIKVLTAAYSSLYDWQQGLSFVIMPQHSAHLPDPQLSLLLSSSYSSLPAFSFLCQGLSIGCSFCPACSPPWRPHGSLLEQPQGSWCHFLSQLSLATPFEMTILTFNSPFPCSIFYRCFNQHTHTHTSLSPIRI